MKSRVYYYEADNLKVAESSARYGFALPFSEGKEVLDLGCGARKGPFLLSRGASYVCAVDISLDAIRHCAKTWPSLKVNYLTASALALPFCDESFDVIVSFEVIEHLSRQDDFLKEISRVLRRGGVLIVSTPNREVMSPNGVFSNPDHVREFSAAELGEFLGLFFDGVEFFGQRPHGRVRLVEQNTRDSYRKIRRLPLSLRRLVPRYIKDILFRLYARLFSKMRSGFEEMQITTDDFPIVKGELFGAHYFIAVCVKGL